MECFAKQKFDIASSLFHKKIDIRKPDGIIKKVIKNNFDSIAKPIDGMGEFEDIIARIGSIQGSTDIVIDKKALLVMCSDNGIVAEGVTQSSSDVTLKVAKNILRGRSSVAVMAAKNNIDCFVYDMGIDSPEEPDGIVNRKIRKGSRDFLKSQAMKEEETLKAVNTGIEAVKELSEKDYKMIALGEMGIGNTTTSSAICASLFDVNVKDVTGRGAGLDDEKLLRKIEVIEEAIKKYDLKHADVFEVLKTVGGYDIAALVGVCLGGAIYEIPVVMDGVITQTAGYVATRFFPEVRDYLFASHKGKEPASELLLNALKLKAVIGADMALGEGTGAVMFLALLDNALCVYKNAAKFDELKMKEYERFEK